MNAQDKKILEQFLYNALTSYRIVPVLYALVNNKHIDSLLVAKALRALTTALAKVGYEGKTADALGILNKHQNWVRYTLYDFDHYVDLLNLPLVKVNTYYLPAMEEQVTGGLLDWNVKAFSTGVVDTFILDIGCGHMPYLHLFRSANKGVLCYKGLDKRVDNYSIRISNNMQYSFITEDAAEEFSAHAITTIEDANVLFWGNSLHCFPEPYSHVQKFLKACPKVQTILILEPTAGSNLDFAFDFHMGVHKEGSVTWSRMLQPVSEKEWSKEEIPASSQHTMYRFTKKT